MKSRFVIPTFIVAAFILSGCGSPQPSTAETLTQTPTAQVTTSPIATPSASPTTVAPTTPPPPKTNDRGQIIKSVGEKAWTTDDDQEELLSFTVTAIESIQCDAQYGTVPTGTALAVHMEIETAADFVGSLTVDGNPGQISFSPYYWKGYTPDDTRMNTVDTNIRSNCLTDRTLLLPDYIGKAEKVKGIVILDVSTPTGSIAYSPWDSEGWIWEYSTE